MGATMLQLAAHLETIRLIENWHLAGRSEMWNDQNTGSELRSNSRQLKG
jgi:hypothetical protein